MFMKQNLGLTFGMRIGNTNSCEEVGSPSVKVDIMRLKMKVYNTKNIFVNLESYEFHFNENL